MDSSTSTPSLRDIRATRDAFPDALVRTTSLAHSNRLSETHGMNVLLKREDEQPVRSYKIRGALAKTLSLSPDERQRGVAGASAGNHAQGIAASGAHLGINGTIFMPRITPSQKIDATRRRAGPWMEIRLEGDTFDETARITQRHCDETGATLIHPFNDIDVIRGQATVSLEISDQIRAMRERLDAVIVPVGGGALLAGTILTLRKTNPDALIFGVEPEGADCMAQSVDAGQPITLSRIDTFVDGAAVARPGDLTYEIVAQAIADGRVRLLKISKNQLCAAMADMLQIDGIITEPAGALSVAALDQIASLMQGKNVVSIVSGSNFDMRRMPKILEHADLHRRTKAYLQIVLPDRPQALAELLAHLDAPKQLNITFLRYDDEHAEGTPPLNVGFESKNGNSADILALLESLDAHQYSYQELTGKPE